MAFDLIRNLVFKLANKYLSLLPDNKLCVVET